MWGSPICASRFTQTACSSFGPYGKGLCGRPQAGPARPALAWALAAGALFAAAFGSFYTGLSRIDYSAGAPILGAVPLVSYVVLLFVLRGHERITRRALAGAFLVVAGVGIIGVTI